MFSLNLDAIKKIGGISKKVLECYEYLHAFGGDPRRAKWLRKRTEAWDLVGENKLWNEKEESEFIKEKQIPIVDNKCVKGTQGKCAIVTAQKPDIKFYPIGSSDLYEAELLKRAHDVIWTKNDGNDVTYEAVEENVVSGVGVLTAFHDNSKGVFGKIINEEMDPDDVYWDIDSRKRDWSDTHVLIAKQRTRSYIKERYPELKDNDVYFGLDKEEIRGGKSTGVTKGDNYAFAETQKQKDRRDKEGEPDEIWEIWAWLLKTKNEHWVIYKDLDTGLFVSAQFEVEKGEDPKKAASKAVPDNGEFDQYWPRTRQKRVVRHIVGKKLISQTDEDGNELDEIENPFGEDSDGDPCVSIIPILGQRNKNGIPIGTVSYARDLNRISSKAFMNFFHHAAHNANAPIVRPDGSKWEGTAGTPGSELVVSKNAPFPPFRLSPGNQGNIDWMSIKTTADNDIYDMFDQPDVMRGKVPEGQKNMSGRLGLALQDLAGNMSIPFMRTVETALTKLAKVNMSLAFRHWPRAQWERLIEPDEWEKWVPEEEAIQREGEEGEEYQGPNADLPPEERAKIKEKWNAALERVCPVDEFGKPTGGGIQIMDIDVKVSVGTGMPTNRMAKFSMALDMAEVGFPLEMVIDFADLPEKDKAKAMLKQQQKAQAEQAMMKMGGK